MALDTITPSPTSKVKIHTTRSVIDLANQLAKRASTVSGAKTSYDFVFKMAIIALSTISPETLKTCNDRYQSYKKSEPVDEIIDINIKRLWVYALEKRIREIEYYHKIKVSRNDALIFALLSIKDVSDEHILVVTQIVAHNDLNVED